MSRDADRARSQSMGVLAIVGGLLFMVGAAVVATLLMLLAWFFLQDQLPGAVAGGDPDKDGNVLDTGIAPPVEPRPGGGGRVVRTDPDDEEDLPDFSANKPGPATVIVPDSMLFFSIEVNCPSGYRSRGKFRGYGDSQMKATAPNVPPDERCMVTFQGSEPAKTWISGHQTKTCTFNPTQCDRVY